MSVFDEIWQKVAVREKSRPYLIAVDGFSCAGKTTFSARLKEHLESKSVNVIAMTLDGFHHPRAIRHQDLSPSGYVDLSFNYERLRDELVPLRTPNRTDYLLQVEYFDLETDAPVEPIHTALDTSAVVIVEGVTSLCTQLRDLYDFKIYLSLSEATCMERGLVRDVSKFGTVAQTRAKYAERFIPGQKLYEATQRPDKASDLVIHEYGSASEAFAKIRAH